MTVRVQASTSEAGITAGHMRAIAELCLDENLFLFVRPSTDDTRRLIERGFATKSMDVHDKSSDWGPMAGLVPVDPEFSKRPLGRPPMLAPEEVVGHGAARPTQLSLPPAMVSDLLGSKIQEVDPSGWAVELPVPHGRRRPVLVRHGHGARGSASGPGRRVDVRVYRATRAPRAAGSRLLFVFTRAGAHWQVSWVRSPVSPGDRVPMTPLLVWAYPQGGGLNPVTGDYDLWMVAPHMSHTPIELHLAASIRPDGHGRSAASGYTALLLRRLNQACGRPTSPVFNHGAEAQNVAFTQPHDKRLVMFTGSGVVRMVAIDEVPSILSDLHKTGYIVSVNKQWASDSPSLLGRTQRARRQAAGEAWARGEHGDEIRVMLRDIRRTQRSSDEMKAWYAELARRLEAHGDDRFHALLNTDLPPEHRVASARMRSLAREIQQTLLGMTNGDLAGSRQGVEPGAVGSTDWAEWEARHREQLQALRRYWGLSH